MRAPARWPLAIVLRLASRRETEARGALGAALAAVESRRVAVREAREALRAHRAASDGAPRAAGPALAAALASSARHASRRAEEEGALAAALAAAEAAHGEARARLDGPRGALAAARGQVDALLERQRAWRAARARDRERRAEDAADETVSARWGGAG